MNNNELNNNATNNQKENAMNNNELNNNATNNQKENAMNNNELNRSMTGAIKAKNLQFFRNLVRNGIDLNDYQDKTGEDIATVAIQNNYLPLLRYLYDDLDFHADDPEKIWDDMKLAAYEGFQEIVRYFIEILDEREAVLIAVESAARHGQKDFLYELLDRYSDYNDDLFQCAASALCSTYRFNMLIDLYCFRDAGPVTMQKDNLGMDAADCVVSCALSVLSLLFTGKDQSDIEERTDQKMEQIRHLLATYHK